MHTRLLSWNVVHITVGINSFINIDQNFIALHSHKKSTIVQRNAVAFQYIILLLKKAVRQWHSTCQFAHSGISKTLVETGFFSCIHTPFHRANKRRETLRMVPTANKATSVTSHIFTVCQSQVCSCIAQQNCIICIGELNMFLAKAPQ